MDFNGMPYLLPLRTVVNLLGLPRHTVGELREAGELRAWRAGDEYKWRYVRADVGRIGGLPMDWGRLLRERELVPRKVFMELLGLCDEEVDGGRATGTIEAWAPPGAKHHRYYRRQMLQLAGYDTLAR